MKLAACFRNDEQQSPSALVGAMTEAMRLFDHQSTGIRQADGGALGYVAAGLPARLGGWMEREHGGNRLLLAGVPLPPSGPLEALLAEVVASDHRRAASILGTLDGVFAALFWDARHRRLVVVTDPFGIQPLYMVRDGRSLMLASELRALCAAGIPVAMDAAGWGQFFSVGNTLGNTTMLHGVSRVPGATVLDYAPATGALDQRTYWEWVARRPDVVDLGHVPTGEIVEILRHEVERYARLSDVSTMLLSGGFDSRIVLAVLRKLGLPTEAISLSHANEQQGADGRFATRIAEAFGVPLSLVPTERDYYSSAAYAGYLTQSEVVAPSLYLFIAQLSERIGPEMHAIWDGFFCGFGLNEAGYPADSFDAFRRHKVAEPGAPVWAAMKRVFASSVYEALREGAETSLRREMAGYSDDAEGVWRFTFLNRGRHRIGPNPVKVYANHVLPFTPGSSRRYWETVARISAPLREAHGVYFQIFEKQLPEALGVPFVSQGGIASAPPWRSFRAFRTAAPELAARALSSALRREYFDWEPSAVQAATLKHVEVEHPDLDPDGVRDVLASDPGPGGPGSPHTVLFYWQAWRAVMAGRLGEVTPVSRAPVPLEGRR